MGQSFIACDREQSFLMPPDVREWLPPRHLAWFVIAAVAEMDLDAFYAAYRVDGRARLTGFLDATGAAAAGRGARALHFDRRSSASALAGSIRSTSSTLGAARSHSSGWNCRAAASSV